MKLSFYKDTLAKLLSERNAWRRASVLLVLSTFILGCALLQKREKTILVPPTLHKSFWVHGDEVSREYLEEMGVYLAKLLLDLSPSTIHHTHAVLLRYATPEAYGALKAQFVREEENAGSLQLSTHFKPSSVLANPTTLTVEVKGILTSYVAGKEIKTSSETLILTFNHRGAGLLLESATTKALEPTHD